MALYKNVARSLLLSLTFSVVLSVNLVYDEYVWTKSIWEQAKIENVLLHANPSDIESNLQVAYPSIKDTVANSLDGPNLRREVSQPEDTDGLSGMSGVIPVDHSQHIKPASAAAQCSMCHVLFTQIWQRGATHLVERLLSESSGADSSLDQILWDVKEVGKQMEELCAEEAPDALLKDQTILRLGDPIGNLAFFVIRERKQGAPQATKIETKAARVACKRLIQDANHEIKSAVVKSLETAAAQLKMLLLKHGIEMGVSGSLAYQSVKDRDDSDATNVVISDHERLQHDLSDKLEDEIGSSQSIKDEEGFAEDAFSGKLSKSAALQVVSLVKEVLHRVGKLDARKGASEDEDEDEDGGEKYEDPLCMDLHPSCERWADSGECDANPTYMVGTTLSKGHCRKACGVCVPRKEGAAAGSLSSVDTTELRKAHPQLESDIEIMLGVMVQSLRSTVCTASKACMTGLSSAGMGTGFVKSDGQGIEAQPTGWKLGKQFYGKASVKRVNAESKAHHESAQAQERNADSEQEQGSLAFEVDVALSKELKGKVLSVPGDFFIFEYWYKNRTRQFHEADSGELTEDYILGRFQRESVNVINATSGTAVMLEDLDKVPYLRSVMQDKSWPYVKQVYSGGEECVLAGNRRVIRKTEARVACSPDEQMHMLVREPDFCQYVFVIYSPALCQVEKFKPIPDGGSPDDMERDDDEYL
ncbi:hypothetical protein CEUSTIGMA_g2877.t1 [Chlamydomonas eustigma]|uniref:Uncharacterized protein n=1 Tax=Chlamydomonas eustigma TaxID=1157962 RepID=A0A250WX64_9CHLO|nr:hypothetical protein CEUSTIGMA_g2877.t1 [Chlamydomonas eustigma]|eukprot:GAX75433.1 hypothetical protein CEUSTIGMA_g2877.t1 [Chlamydomonas eustigma]